MELLKRWMTWSLGASREEPFPGEPFLGEPQAGKVGLGAGRRKGRPARDSSSTASGAHPGRWELGQQEVVKIEPWPRSTWLWLKSERLSPSQMTKVGKSSHSNPREGSAGPRAGEREDQVLSEKLCDRGAEDSTERRTTTSRETRRLWPFLPGSKD